jgi:hypothetical protein
MTPSPDRSEIDQEQPQLISMELSRRHFDAECAFNASLAQFQAAIRPVENLDLATIVAAAQPAFELGFCYLIRQDSQAIEVCLRHSAGAEECSSADASALCSPSLLLAGLLGIPVAMGGQASEPEQPVQHYADPASTADPAGVEQAQGSEASAAPVIAAVAAEPEPDLMGSDSPPDRAGDHPSLRLLTAAEIEAAVGMVKVMAPPQRKAFTVAFRCAFEVSDTVTRIASEITQVRHLEFIDRFTVEAAGGIAS